MANKQVKLRQIEGFQTLYHYTKSSGINGIINHNCFWATKSDFLNDPNEFSYIERIIISVCKEYIAEKDLREMFLEDVLKEHLLLNSGKSRDYFVLSFSSCPDSITMWSEFGNKTGYNIGLNGRQITERIKEKNDIEYHGFVIYDVEQQKQIIRRIISTYIPELLDAPFIKILEAGAKDRECHIYQKACRKFFRMTSLYAMFFKHEAFAQEKEYRFVFKRQNDTVVHFREKDGFLIPYIEVPLSEELLPVKRIMVAPQNHIDLAKNGMEYMMKNKGYQVEVVLSDIKLRY